MSNPIYLALDLPRLDAAIALAQKVRGHIGGLKLGLEFFCANGHHGVHEMMKFGLPIFLDLKLHDIPNTVAKAVQALHGLEPAVLTVHAAGGRAMLEDAKAAAGTKTKVVAVTVLTSLDNGDLNDIGVNGAAEEQVTRLAELARDAGLDGIVCSGEEVATSARSVLSRRRFMRQRVARAMIQKGMAPSRNAPIRSTGNLVSITMSPHRRTVTGT